MTFNEIMQKVGRKIKKNIFYYKNNEKKYVNKNDFKNANLWFDTNIIGTSMYILDIDLKENIRQEEVYYEVNAIYGNETQKMVYGPFFLKEEPKYNANDKTYSYQYCDFFIKSMIDYQPINITYPCSLQEYFNKLNETLGYTSSVSLINGNRILERDIYNGINFTYRDVYTDIGQANGILLYANKLEIKEAIFTDDNSVTLTDKILKNTNVEFGEHVGPYNSIVLSRSGDSDNIYIQDEESIKLNGLHEFKISDNQLMNDNNRSDYLPGLLEKLKGIEFDTFDVEITGYGGFTPLQKVNFITGNNQYSSYVFANEMSFTDGFTESLSAPLPEETVTDYSASDKTDRRINQAYIIVDKQNQKINSLTRQVEEYTEKFSEVEQTVDGITQRVNAMYEFAREISGNNKVRLEESQENGIIELHIFGEIIQPIVSETTIVSEKTMIKSTHLVFENDKGKHKVYLPINYLYKLDDISDEFIWQLIYNEDLNDYKPQAKIIRRIVVIDGVKKKRLQPIEENIGSFNIEFPKGSYNVYLESFNGLDYQIEYAILNQITDQFAIKVEVNSLIEQTAESITSSVNKNIEGVNENLSSEIKQTADSINSEVRKKVGNDEVISKINQSPEEVMINANKISLVGKEINLTGDNTTITSQNFSVDSTGAVTAKNMSILGGTLNISTRGKSAIITLNDTLNNTTLTIGGSELRVGKSNVYTELTEAIINFNDGSYSSSVGADIFELHYGSSYTTINARDGIYHSSLEKYKKLISEYRNNLNLIKDCSVYEYLFKEEDDDSEKHIGLIIGDKYNTPEEVISKSKDGIDLFNMCGVMWGAIKELSEELDELKKEMNK